MKNLMLRNYYINREWILSPAAQTIYRVSATLSMVLVFILMPLHRRIDDMSQSLLRLDSCIYLCPWGGDHDGCHGIFSLRVRHPCLFQEIVLVLRHAIPPAWASSLLLHSVFAVKCTSEIRRPAGKRPSVRRGPTKQAG